MGRFSSIKWGVRYKAEHPRWCNVRPRSSAYGYPYCPHGSRGPIWLCPSCDKSSRAYNRDVGYDSQIVTFGGGVTRQTAEEGVGQVT
eukprot:COSAG05_NODE_892_length_6724_cov_32.630491_3_plen_87_part_00